MDLSFIPTVLSACGLTIFLLIWWDKKHKIKFQPYYSYNLQEEKELATGDNAAINSTAQITEENSSEFFLSTSNEEYSDELHVIDTLDVDRKKPNEEDKKHELKILLEEQDYLENLAGRKIASKINIKDTLRVFFQNQTVKTILLIIGALILFAGVVVLTIIAGKNSWFG